MPMSSGWADGVIFTYCYQREAGAFQLAVIHALVDPHGGVIAVSSTVGVGNTFCFMLPHANGPF